MQEEREVAVCRGTAVMLTAWNASLSPLSNVVIICCCFWAGMTWSEAEVEEIRTGTLRKMADGMHLIGRF
ncbi:unnamed protein product [Thlaspi arvense]|uniref:Uncharacterized protein n=1 Tax=Thlaspi arvense TaxID=13288 RepID=A0AAU9RTI0_THLAR|nr:unnamed protein product [Thlaspi arvense]